MFPVKIVGVTGPIEIAVRVGLTKNPRQLIASARVASAAKAPISLIRCLVDDIFLKTPWARPIDSRSRLSSDLKIGTCKSPNLQIRTCKNCSREDFAGRTLTYLAQAHGTIPANLIVQATFNRQGQPTRPSYRATSASRLERLAAGGLQKKTTPDFKRKASHFES